VLALLDRLMDVVAGGGFVPTDSSDDCRFCDYAAICRVREPGWGRIDSPLASWSAEQLSLGLHPAFALLRRVRGFEG
jgi:hypothetical protein